MRKKILMAAAFVAALPVQQLSAQTKQQMTVFKTPSCGCCQVWVEAMEKAGYQVQTRNMEDLSAIKKQANISSDIESCHTAVIGSDRKYVVEGHVPIEAIEKLMSERPDILGISVPGMPAGSLGMGYDPSAKYDVLAFGQTNNDKPEIFYQAGQK